MKRTVELGCATVQEEPKQGTKRSAPLDEVVPLGVVEGVKKPEESVQPKKKRKSDCKPRTSKYLGVCWMKERKVWRARIEVAGKREHLGYFAKEVDAALAYDKRARSVLRKSSRLNFPEINNDVHRMKATYPTNLNAGKALNDELLQRNALHKQALLNYQSNLLKFAAMDQAQFYGISASPSTKLMNPLAVSPLSPVQYGMLSMPTTPISPPMSPTIPAFRQLGHLSNVNLSLAKPFSLGPAASNDVVHPLPGNVRHLQCGTNQF